MIKIVTIIGARPQIIKAAAISRAIRNKFSHSMKEIIVHTGQHYDENMSEIFFSEMEIPKPDYNLKVGSDMHGKQTARMIIGIEEILLNIKPDYLLIYGDTNSTLAGSVAASKLHIPIVHIESGMRSYNKLMPEEINRIISDHCSTLLFTPTKTGYENLLKEGFTRTAKPPISIDNPCVYHCGDIMYDNSLFFAKKAESQSQILNRHGINKNIFLLSTIHRDNNTDNPKRLNAIFNGLNNISIKKNIKVVVPLHPRTSKLLKKNLNPNTYESIKTNKNFMIIAPASYLDMIMLEKHCRMIFTDSGGVQKEAYFFKKPCAILRSETEWVEIVKNRAALITDADEREIESAYDYFSNKKLNFPAIFGNGKAAEFICSEIIKTLSK